MLNEITNAKNTLCLFHIQSIVGDVQDYYDAVDPSLKATGKHLIVDRLNEALIAIKSDYKVITVCVKSKLKRSEVARLYKRLNATALTTNNYKLLSELITKRSFKELMHAMKKNDFLYIE